MSFGYLFSIVFQGAKWERVVLFLSTIPIAIFMNSMRIGVVGILVHNFGIEQAEGFLHLSEGWVVFVACLAILYAEASILSLFHTAAGKSKWTVLDLGFDRLGQSLNAVKNIRDYRPLAATTGMFLVGIVVVNILQGQPPNIPDRKSFANFPTTLGEYNGKATVLTHDIERVLGADDYLVSNFVSQTNGVPVNLFVAYYKTQNQGNAVHSPEVCIPGAGWEISRLETKNISLGGCATVPVKRAIIQKGQTRRLVYYWFKERERTVANEWAAKWFIFWDSVTKNRSDGAIVQLITPIDRSTGEAAADQQLRDYMKLVKPELASYLPQ